MSTILQSGKAITALVAIAVLSFGGAPRDASAHAITGALFTTTQDGSTVNANLYASKCGATGVWLNGGPQGPNPGLPAGDYVFQVTDPSGATLLSTDTPVNRLVNVDSSGRFVSLMTTSSSTGNQTGTHATNSLSSPTRITVQLCPFDNTPNPGGEYKVWLTRISDFEAASVGNCVLATGLNPSGDPCNGNFGFVPGHVKTDNFKAPDDNGGGPPSGDNTISGRKFYDANVNGIDNSEAGIQGWEVCISGGPQGFEPFCTTTDANGSYSFTGLEVGTYGVCEKIPANAPLWLPTTVTGYAGIVVPEDSTENDFGNVCLGAGGGKTLGFWSNKNGQKIITDNTCLAGLTSHDLVNGSGTDVTPFGDYGAFRTWLLSANATNMAYMLSAQKAAMLLNRDCSGTVSGSALVHAPGCGNTGLNNAFISIDDLIDAADAQITAHPLTTAANDPTNRAVQECLKNALDAANNNTNFVQSAPCAVNYSGLETCTPE